MTKFKQFHLKNEMMGANFLANFIGVFFVNALMLIAEGKPPIYVWSHPVAYWIDTLFTPFAFGVVALATLAYEKPIRKYLNNRFCGEAIGADMASVARRRLLNEPFVLICFSFSMWLLASIVYPAIHWASGTGAYMIQRSICLGISAGLITITIAFFLLEHILQKKLAPHFFPEGGLTKVPRTLRIRIRTRLVALLFACNLIPLVSILLILLRVSNLPQDAASTLKQLQIALYTNVFIYIGVGIYLTGLVSKNLTIPFTEIIQTLRDVRNGRFDKKVQVTTNDEIGYTGDVINEMTEGLRERQRLQQSLDIAMEVQQNLLPGQPPQIEGLDIAGTSIYCEETGGDYYDYIMTEDGEREKICVVVGDVADHGLPSALLMTTARAFLRQRASQPGELDQVVSDVNRQLVRDVEDSGRFMTLLICAIDSNKQVVKWVNAGHDPAMIYAPNAHAFEELGGNALPLGVSETATYRSLQKPIAAGQMILLSTDGIWEAQSPGGEMFGKTRFKDLIRQHADQPARDIVQAVLKAVDDFCNPLEKTDDVTLVIIKII